MAAYLGTGSTITFESAGLTAQIIDITLPEGSRGDVDITHMTTADDYDSGDTPCREFIPTDLLEWGTLDFTIMFDKTEDYEALLGRPPEEITVEIPNNSAGVPFKWEFEGYMTKFQGKVPLEDKMTADVSIQVDGPIDIASA